jgi:CMP-N-acetylneuraminic acid synthetase
MTPEEARRRLGRTLGLVPAKGGSTRLRRKNVVSLGGLPLIGWTIAAARDSAMLDRLVVSTEDPEIAAIAREAGAETPFERPEPLARDPASVVDVALHSLDALEGLGDRFRTLVILLPTCPFRSPEDVRAAARLFAERDGRFLMSVGPYPHTPFAALALGDDGLLTPHFPEWSGRKSQEMPRAWRPNGALHILDVDAFRAARSYYAQPLIGYAMPAERSVDIDTAEDLALAEFMLARGVALG